MPTRFEFRDFAKVFALSIFLFGSFSMLFAVIPGAAQVIEGFHPTLSFAIQYVLQFVILFFPLWIFVVDKYNATLTDFGFVPVKATKLISTVFLNYFTYLLLSGGIALLLYSNELEIPGYGDQESYMPVFGYDFIGFTAAILFVTFLAPFLEELFFRGFVYRVFVKTWPKWLGSFLTAALFSLVHFQIHTFFPLLILGLFFNYTYERTGSVWTSMVFHSLNNTVAFGLDMYLYFHPEVLQQLEGTTGLVYNTLKALI